MVTLESEQAHFSKCGTVTLILVLHCMITGFILVWLLLFILYDVSIKTSRGPVGCKMLIAPLLMCVFVSTYSVSMSMPEP